MKRIGVALILVLALGGIADSAYIATHELSGTPLLCDVQNLSGCNIVAQSPYAHMFGVPVAVYGVLFYAILAVLAALELFLFDQLLRRTLQAAALVGIAASAYFVGVQVFLIGALCVYCLASALIALLAFVLATFIEPLHRVPQTAS